MARRSARWFDPTLPGQIAEVGLRIAAGAADRRDGQRHHIDEASSPVRGESLLAKHFRQALGVEPGITPITVASAVH